MPNVTIVRDSDIVAEVQCKDLHVRLSPFGGRSYVFCTLPNLLPLTREELLELAGALRAMAIQDPP